MSDETGPTAVGDWPIEHLESCTSTQEEARLRAQRGAPHGTVIVAAHQTAGHGQRDRTWESPEGGLYLSVVLRNIHNPHLLTLALGNAVADALEVAGADPALKWVNDVWIEGRKVAGILVEGESTGDTFDFLLAGIGINVNEPEGGLPEVIRDQAVALQTALGAESCIPDLETFLLESMQRWVDLVARGRHDEVLSTWRRRDALQNQAIRLLSPTGKELAQGVARGIDDQGRIRIEAPDGTIQAFDNGTIQTQN